jgi:3-dehydroquinate synthetase
MTNIKKKTTREDMQMHIDKAFIIIEEHLPQEYVNKVMDKLQSKTITRGIIRNVRNKTGKVENKIEVVNALVEVALEHKAEKEKLLQLTT